MNYALVYVGNKDFDAYKEYTAAEAIKIKDKTLILDVQYASYAYSYKNDTQVYIKNNAPRLA